MCIFGEGWLPSGQWKYTKHNIISIIVYIHPFTSPPNFLTPRFLGSESRPFFVDPAVFFVAQRLNVKLNPSPDISKTSKLIYYVNQINLDPTQNHTAERSERWNSYQWQNCKRVYWLSEPGYLTGFYAVTSLYSSYCLQCEQRTWIENVYHIK